MTPQLNTKTEQNPHAGGRGTRYWLPTMLKRSRGAVSGAGQSTHTIPLGRYGKPEEYGNGVSFLASDRAAYLTGSVIRINGRLIASLEITVALNTKYSDRKHTNETR
jgi:NAD(P)-dependent dehydrogenase (short-subunit alcohol dehydrogenase family)